MIQQCKSSKQSNNTPSSRVKRDVSQSGSRTGLILMINEQSNLQTKRNGAAFNAVYCYIK